MKRGVWLLALLMSVSVVMAVGQYYTYDKGVGYTPVTYPYFSSEAWYEGLGETFSSITKLPDLTVEINMPDVIPIYTTLEDLTITVKNKGVGKAKGYIYVDVWFDSLNMPSCRTRAVAGGGLGQTDPRYSSRQIRSTTIFPGQEIEISLFTPRVKTGVPFSCQRPLTSDVTIYAQVNPPGGSRSSGLAPRGRILESDHSNNLVSKTVRVSSSLDVPVEVPVKLSVGMNAFSLPVDQKISVQKFRETTGCELLQFTGFGRSYSGTRMFDMAQTTLVPLYENLQPGVVYFARCSFPSSIKFYGTDPGPSNVDTNYRALTLLPTRIGMQGKRLDEVLRGCSHTYSGGPKTKFYGLVPGRSNVARKMISESLPSYNNIVPGQAYVVFCDSSFGGTWDPEEGSYSLSLLRPDRPGFLPFRQRARGSSYRYPSRAGAGFGGYTYVFRGLSNR